MHVVKMNCAYVKCAICQRNSFCMNYVVTLPFYMLREIKSLFYETKDDNFIMWILECDLCDKRILWQKMWHMTQNVTCGA